MPDETISDKDRKKAQGCMDCPVCSRARRKQKGIAYWLVRLLERGLCPECKAYEKVYGRKAHEPIPEGEAEATDAPAPEGDKPCEACQTPEEPPTP